MSATGVTRPSSGDNSDGAHSYKRPQRPCGAPYGRGCQYHTLLHIRGDIPFDGPEFRIREGQLPKSSPMLARGVPRHCAVRAVQDAAETKLANAGRDQLALLLPAA